MARIPNRKEALLGQNEEHRPTWCGPYSLKHALGWVFGRFEDVTEIARASNARGGTTKEDLQSGAEAFGLKVSPFQTQSTRMAFQTLNRHLRRGWPCVLDLVKSEHWVLAAANDGGEYVVFDSSSKNVATVCSKEALRKVWQNLDDSDGDPAYWGVALRPAKRTGMVARWTVDTVRQLRLHKGGRLYFGEYLGILERYHCSSRCDADTTVPMFDVMKRSLPVIKDEIVFWHGDRPCSKEADRILGMFLLMTQVYGLRVRKSQEAGLVAGITANLAWAVGRKFGIDGPSKWNL